MSRPSDVRQDVVGLLVGRLEAVEQRRGSYAPGVTRHPEAVRCGWQRRQPGSGRACSHKRTAGPLLVCQLAEEAMPHSRRHASASTPPKHRPAHIHRPSRRWWAPWRSRCACGLSNWPCQATCRSAPADTCPPARSRTQHAASAGSAPKNRQRPSWDGPTILLTPLLTRGQRWRSNGGAE
jgi:hypothetical protein